MPEETVRPEIRAAFEAHKQAMKPEKMVDVHRSGVENIQSPYISSEDTDFLPEYVGGQVTDPPEQRVGGHSLVGRLFDVLFRGEYASANIAKDYIMGKPFSMNAAMEGLKGERKSDYMDISEAVFSDWSPWKRKSMGLALSIFADPTTYLPSGALTAPLKLAARVPIVKKGLQS